jgi:hypothetical protein
VQEAFAALLSQSLHVPACSLLTLNHWSVCTQLDHFRLTDWLTEQVAKCLQCCVGILKPTSSADAISKEYIHSDAKTDQQIIRIL